MTADPDYWHAKGEQDYPNNWNPPIDEINSLLTNYDDNAIINMRAYKDGWENARNQAGK